MRKLQYEVFERQSREEVKKALQSTDPSVVRSALYIAAQYEPDWRWTQEICLSMLRKSTDQQVRWAAALSLGFIALYHKQLDLDRVLPELHRLREDPDIRGPVQDSLELISQNIRKQ
jgi:hypothetical protein